MSYRLRRLQYLQESAEAHAEASSLSASSGIPWEWLLGGFAIGFAVGWPASRGLLASSAKISIDELERRAERWAEER